MKIEKKLRVEDILLSLENDRVINVDSDIFSDSPSENDDQINLNPQTIEANIS